MPLEPGLRLPGSVAGSVGGGAVCREGEMRLDLPQDRILAAGPDHPSLLLPPLEHDEGRNAHDTITASGLRVVVHIELHGLELLGVVPGDLLDQRRDHVAPDAPLRPEVDQDRPLGLEDLTLEIIIAHMCDTIRHVASSSSSPLGGGASQNPYLSAVIPLV